MVENISAKEVIETVIDVIVGSYGSLGYLGFRIHSIKPNCKENVFIVKYSFIPRDNKEGKRFFYEARVNIKDKSMFETKEIQEEELTKE